MIELPLTLRPANFDEVPRNSSVLERLKEIANAKIVEGYNLKDKEKNNSIPFNFYSEINVNNSRLWDLVIGLMEVMPNDLALIIGLEGEEPNYGNYIDKIELIKQIGKYKKELTQDTYLEWGIIYNDSETLIEIFIVDSKYVKFWGVDIDSFQNVMFQHNLPQTNDLEFIDEFPKVRIPLKLIDESASDTLDLINKLKII
jgi:hypothetical protein